MNAGIILAGSSDCPIVPQNPLIGVSTAVSRKAQTGSTVLPEEGISILDAFRLYTSNAAYLSHEEDISGTISPGKRADLVAVNDDPTQIPPEGIKDLKVEMTMIHGEVVWRSER